MHKLVVLVFADSIILLNGTLANGEGKLYSIDFFSSNSSRHTAVKFEWTLSCGEAGCFDSSNNEKWSACWKVFFPLKFWSDNKSNWLSHRGNPMKVILSWRQNYS
jgi:hypothetical protein